MGSPSKNCPLLHHRNIVGDIGNIRYDVRGQDNNFLFCKIGYEVAETYPLIGIKPGSGFIQYQNRGMVQLRLGDSQTLLHSAGIGFDFFCLPHPAGLPYEADALSAILPFWRQALLPPPYTT